MKRLKIVSVVWGILVVLLFSGLTTIGFIYKKKTAKYKKLEDRLVEVTKKYTATDFNFPKNGDEIIITYKELEERGLIKELKVDKQKCDGYVKLTFNGVTEYKGFIKCEKYKTHNFNNDYLK